MEKGFDLNFGLTSEDEEEEFEDEQPNHEHLNAANQYQPEYPNQAQYPASAGYPSYSGLEGTDALQVSEGGDGRQGSEPSRQISDGDDFVDETAADLDAELGEGDTSEQQDNENDDDTVAELEAELEGVDDAGEDDSGGVQAKEQQGEGAMMGLPKSSLQLSPQGSEDSGGGDANRGPSGLDLDPGEHKGGNSDDDVSSDSSSSSSSKGSKKSGGSDYNAAEEDGPEEDSSRQADEATSSKPQEPLVVLPPPPKRRVITKKKPVGSKKVPAPDALPPPPAPFTADGARGGGATVIDVADHYSNRENQRKDVRDSSPIIHLKKLNNWIKSVLIRKYTKEGDAVLDLACGKGGDLIKWDFAKIGFYVGVDVARGSIYDAASRYNGESSTDGHDRKFRFPAKLVCADGFGHSLEDLSEFGPFDVCSCQFALHYSFQNEERARIALGNVSALLAPGGHFIGTIPDANVIVQKLRKAQGLKFGNLVYSIEFDGKFGAKIFPKSNPFGIEYLFNLEDAVACPEWLIPFPSLQKLAEEYDLELVEKRNFHDFIHHYVGEEEMAQIMRRVVGRAWHSTVTPDEWDAAYLYCAFVFRKRGEPDPSRKRKRTEAPSRIQDDDIMFLGQIGGK